MNKRYLEHRRIKILNDEMNEDTKGLVIYL